MLKTGSAGLRGSIVGMFLIAVIFPGLSNLYAANWNDQTAPIDDRVADLMTKLSTQQKILLRDMTSPSIPGLALPIVGVQWWTEMQNGHKTIFPASIGKVGTWDPDLMFAVGQVYGNEARNDYKSTGQQFYSPAMVNDALDPRDGRNDETWGEDPFLSGLMAGSLVKGAQGNRQYLMAGGGEYYMQISLMAKHLIGNNHEDSRYNDIAKFDERDFYEWFLPPFKALVDADVGGIMTGLNPITLVGNPQVTNIENVVCPFTLDTILRKQWAWKGYTTSDCNGVSAAQQVPALAAGLDAECEDKIEVVMNDTNAVNKAALNQAVSRLFRLRMRMGEFDPACPYRTPPPVNLNANDLIALQAAREAVVLAKNTGNILPIDKTKIKSIVLIGPVASYPNATNTDGFQQNYFGGYSGWPSLASTPVNFLKGMQTETAADGITFNYIVGMDNGCINGTFSGFNSADQQKITSAQVVIVAVGCGNNDNNGWANGACKNDNLYPGEGRDLSDIILPGAQAAMIKAAYGYNRNVVVVLQDQEIRSIPFAFDTCPAVVISLTGGQEVGKGITDVLFGNFNPSGRTAETWLKNISDYPAKSDCSVRGTRTYMYFTGPVFYPFGHGLSYTTFGYSNITAVQKAYNPSGPSTDTVATIKFDLKNTGTLAGAEVAQLYTHAINPAIVRPIKELRNLKRMNLPVGADSTIAFSITKRDLAYWNTTNKAYTVDNGLYEIQIGSTSADIRLRDTISIPTTSVLNDYKPNAGGQATFKTIGLAKIITSQRVFVDSRNSHFSFDENFHYGVFTCNGKKLAQGGGVDINNYLSHAAHGIYLVMGQKKF